MILTDRAHNRTEHPISLGEANQSLLSKGEANRIAIQPMKRKVARLSAVHNTDQGCTDQSEDIYLSHLLKHWKQVEEDQYNR